jgi:glycolate oxidase FAD binding subunit
MSETPIFGIDDFNSIALVQPHSVWDLCEEVQRAAARESAIYPLGGRTMLNLGMPPTRRGVAIDLRRLDQILDFPARDMTITVQAGITIRRLQEITAAENLRLPIDVPLADRATLGGAIATNCSGPRRYGFGTLRDYVIGISVINDEGHETKAGGRVVKNVAGYDLCKLHVGALGTLGVISQVTLKLRPRPEASALLWFGCETDGVEKSLDLLHRSRTRPISLDLLNNLASRSLFEHASQVPPPMPWLIFLGYEDNRESVHWQLQTLRQELAGSPACRIDALIDDAARGVWDALVDWPVHEECRVVFKANLPSHATAQFCLDASRRSESILLHAHAGNGIVIGHLAPATALEETAAILNPLREIAAAQEGNLILLRCPSAWKKALPVWGNPSSDNWLMKAVKDKLDPRGLFNPGRFVAGI